MQESQNNNFWEDRQNGFAQQNVEFLQKKEKPAVSCIIE